MKSSIYYISFTIILACNSQKEGESNLPTLAITMDTVMIDPGQEILFLNAGLRQSALSEDKKYLYNVNSKENSIEQINLNTLAFEKKHPFEKEGPNGVGNGLSSFSLIDAGKLFINSNSNESIFNWQGKKLESLKLFDMGMEQGLLDEGDSPYKFISLPRDGIKFACLIFNWEKKSAVFAMIDREKKTFKKMDIPGIEKAKNFEIIHSGEKTSIFFGANRYLVKEGGKVILGTSVSSELYVLDETVDTLQHINFNSQLTPNEKSGTYPAKIGDMAQFEIYFQKIQEDISFLAPVWDEKKQVFYRFSYQMKFDENAKVEEGQPFAPPKEADVYLSILDKDLNLIAEGPFQTLDSYPGFHFGKDGKLWVFENIEDEMGFVRLDITW